VAEVVKSLRQAPALEMGDLPMQSVREAMAETYRRGRKALKRAEKDGTSESFHEFRKLAKQRWYHLRLFEDGDPTTKQLDDLHELETSLGDDHNLSVLRERLRAEAETNRDREQTRNLMGWIEEESQNLRRRALELGERLYSEKTANVPKKPAVDAYPFRARSAVA
jgi:CHAD domain-containing protein